MADIPKVESVTDILEINDLHALRRLAKTWNVDLTGCKNVDDLRERLIRHLKEKINPLPPVSYLHM